MSNIQELLTNLHKLDEEQRNLAMCIMKADGGNFYSLDFLYLAALNRSHSSINGFISLLESRNYFAAIPFVRMQLDSVLRLSATKLVADPNGLAEQILNGIHISKIKDKNGNKMRDAYLVEIVAANEPWITNVYESGSGFIHLSNKHMFGLFSESKNNGEFRITLGPSQNHIPEEFRIEAVAAISHITSLLIKLCNEWLSKKQFVKNQPNQI